MARRAEFLTERDRGTRPEEPKPEPPPPKPEPPQPIHMAYFIGPSD
jgi:hypothetical protein